jgi:hypothetical protein
MSCQLSYHLNSENSSPFGTFRAYFPLAGFRHCNGCVSHAVPQVDAKLSSGSTDGYNPIADRHPVPDDHSADVENPASDG